MRIDRGIVQCDRCKRIFKTKEVTNYKSHIKRMVLKMMVAWGL